MPHHVESPCSPAPFRCRTEYGCWFGAPLDAAALQACMDGDGLTACEAGCEGDAACIVDCIAGACDRSLTTCLATVAKAFYSCREPIGTAAAECEAGVIERAIGCDQDCFNEFGFGDEYIACAQDCAWTREKERTGQCGVISYTECYAALYTGRAECDAAELNRKNADNGLDARDEALCGGSLAKCKAGCEATRVTDREPDRIERQACLASCYEGVIGDPLGEGLPECLQACDEPWNVADAEFSNQSHICQKNCCQEHEKGALDSGDEYDDAIVACANIKRLCLAECVFSGDPGECADNCETARENCEDSIETRVGCVDCSTYSEGYTTPLPHSRIDQMFGL